MKISPLALICMLSACSAATIGPGASAPNSSSGPATASVPEEPTPLPANPAAIPAEEAPASPYESETEAPALAFSIDQANFGRDVFRASCTACHSSSEFSDRSFKFKWRRRSAGDLYRHMYSTMPEDAPGSLAPSEYVALVAYVLRLNGVDAGEGELPADEEALEGLSLAAIAN